VCSPAGRPSILKLIDSLGDEQAAIDWLAKEKNVDAKTRFAIIRSSVGSATCRSCTSPRLGCSTPVGLGALAGRFREWGAVQAVERLNLDGLLAALAPSYKQLMPEAYLACGK